MEYNFKPIGINKAINFIQLLISLIPCNYYTVANESSNTFVMLVISLVNSNLNETKE